MTKKAAMSIAAGLVSALVAGAAAFTLGLSAPQTSSAAAPAKHQKPIIRTLERTITVHKKAKDQKGSEVRVINAPTTGQPAVSGGDDDGYEHESGDDDGFENEGGEDD